jgi:hypothetical protein
MSRTTDRINSPQNLINLAREQFEAQQRSQLPSIVIELPSKGKTYPQTHPLSDGIVEMRYPTAYDEDILTNSSYIKQGVVIDRLIESLCITKFDINDLIVADKEKLILSARILAYGPEYPVVVKDPKTKNDLNRIVDLHKITSSELTLDSDENGEFEYEIDETTKLKFILPTAKILNNLSDDHAISDLLNGIIREVNGDRNVESIKTFTRYQFLSEQSKQFRRYVGDHTPKIDTTYEFEGEDGGTFAAGFQFGPDLFWT